MSTKKAFCWICSAALDRSYTVVGEYAYCSNHLNEARAAWVKWHDGSSGDGQLAAMCSALDAAIAKLEGSAGE